MVAAKTMQRMPGRVAITDPHQPLLVSTRTIAVSPFAEDHQQTLYFGGFDCSYVSSHNTGWVYRAELGPR
jgi:hypothetical protein